jgi:hypothetical protein
VPKTVPEPTTGGEPHVSDDIFETAAGSGLRLIFGAIAWKWNAQSLVLGPSRILGLRRTARRCPRETR